MLLHAGLGDELWVEATTYLVNIYNRIPPSKPDKKGGRLSQYEKLYNERPIFSDLKPLGCRVSVSDKIYHERDYQVLYMSKDFNNRKRSLFYYFLSGCVSANKQMEA